MRYTIRDCMSVIGAAAVLAWWCGSSGVAAAEAAATAPPDVLSSEWQHRRLTFAYQGFTTSYTCDGLADHVRQILLYLGARKDLKVIANGCPGPFNSPSRSAFVNVDFYVLAPRAGAPAVEALNAHWTAIELTSRHPDFMGSGDCELIEGMKDFITKNFTLRAVEYRTRCFPNQTVLNGFSVKAEALTVLPSAPSG